MTDQYKIRFPVVRFNDQASFYTLITNLAAPTATVLGRIPD